MERSLRRPDVNRVFSRLKDFQRATADYVFKRMYEDADCTTRFLVADEVGLGKTLVAGGVIARAVDYLWDKVERIDVVYICSNSGIARQNVRRLQRSLGGSAGVLPSRITLLPRVVRNLRESPLNLVSFTPGTSFDLQSALGTAEERALLYWLLPESWKESERGAISLLTGSAARAGFEARVKDYLRRNSIDESLRLQFRGLLDRDVSSNLKERFVALAGELGGRAASLTDEERKRRTAVVGELRGSLAASCIESLEPDLIVLDEFQRFKHLLDGEGEGGQLARQLFSYRDPRTQRDARVLLLSATPYKMYTLADEIDGEDHFTDFVRTIAFLQNSSTRTNSFRVSLDNYRRALLQFDTEKDHTITPLKEDIEQELRRVMVRTERLAASSDRNGMLSEMPAAYMQLEVQDLDSYLAVQRVGRVIEQGDTLEYWKSAPYLLNFMEDYQIKREFENAVDGSSGAALYEALKAGPAALLTWQDVEAYRKVDPRNARLRNLIEDLAAHDAWRLFWLPPALPYYRLQADFSNPASARFTKRLVFSSWQVVPKVVAALASYDAERRLLGLPELGEPNTNTPEARRKKKGLLQFSFSDDRLSGMPVLAMLYPSLTLAEVGDPLQVAARLRGNRGEETSPGLADVLVLVRREIEQILDELPVGSETGSEDEAWYWAAPILLDMHRHREATRNWFAQPDLTAHWREVLEPETSDGVSPADEVEERGDDAWSRHVEQARRVAKGEFGLGRRPADLAKVLALLAVAGPGTVSLRALSRVAGGMSVARTPEVRNAAGRLAEGFRTLFNIPEVTAYLQRTKPAEPYWQRVLDYCAEGCLQAVLDEYAHAAVEWTQASGRPGEIASELAKEMLVALTLRTANLGVDVITLDDSARRVLVQSEPRGFRARFALRFGERKGEEGAAASRQDAVRKAFNSPFWPFVLCSTSVGQEGLDFHLYCHAIVHWNLPANPVDLEQREGRIHRFKGHAVRKNLALEHGHTVLANGDPHDPWRSLVDRAVASRGDSDSDLVPFWLYPVDGGARIERHIPALPLSRDIDRAKLLRQSLVVYRMAFGQSRQEDLVAFLLSKIPADAIESVAERLRIDLAPPECSRTQWTFDAAPEGPVGTEPTEQPVAWGTVANPTLAEWTPDLDTLTELLNRSAELLSTVPTSPNLEALRQLVDEVSRLRANAVGEVDIKALTDVLDRFASLAPIERRARSHQVEPT